MITQLTPHFSLAEFTLSQDAVRKGINNELPENLLSNAVAVCTQVENVRSFFDNRPITVSSGYRSPQVNADVGGVADSAHTKACAMDFNIKGLTPWEVVITLKNAANVGRLTGIIYDQIIYEYGSWIHFGIAASGKPRFQFLTIDHFGTREGLWAIRQ